MSCPTRKDAFGSDAIAGGSGRSLQLTSSSILFVMIAAFAVSLCNARPASAKDLIGTVIRVADGDTLTIRTAKLLDHTIRIGGIDAPEKSQAFGNHATQNLASLSLEKVARAECYKTDQYKRKVCRVFVDDRDVGLEQVKVGAAWWYRRFAGAQSRAERVGYEKAEDDAKAQSLGLWRDNEPMPPWVWRHAKKSGGPKYKTSEM